MGQISRPMQIVLAVTLLFAAAWFVVLRPKDGVSSTSAPAASSSSTAPGVKGLGRAVDKAKGAVATSEQQAKKLGAASAAASAATTPSAPSVVTSGSAAGTTGTVRAGTTASATVVTGATSGRSAVARANRALATHKVLAILFYNPRAADDRAVRSVLAHAKTHHGKVVKVAAPLSRLAAFTEVTKRTAVTGSPTIVLFDRLGQPSSLVGFTDTDELNARITDALTNALGQPSPPPTP